MTDHFYLVIDAVSALWSHCLCKEGFPNRSTETLGTLLPTVHVGDTHFSIYKSYIVLLSWVNIKYAVFV